MMKAILFVIGWLLMAAGVQADGFSRVVAVPASGVADVSLGGSNVWRPVSVALVFDEPAERTITVYRHVADLTYPIASITGTGSSFVYVFEGAFWFGGAHFLRVVVEPAGPGIMEVIGE